MKKFGCQFGYRHSVVIFARTILNIHTMKKSILFFGLCAFCFVPCSANENHPVPFVFVETTSELPPSYDAIELLGELMYSVGPDAIEAGVSTNDVCVLFHQNLGDVRVSLYNESGALLYNNIVHTGVQPSLYIPINSNYNGSYYIEVNSAVGDAGGGFEGN